MSKVSGVRPVPEPRREFFESDEAYRYFLDLTRALKSLQVGTADDLASHQHTVSDVTDLTLGKTIGDVPQYEDDGSGNPVVDHPNMPLVGGDPVGVFGHALLHVQDQKAPGTDGGDFNSGAWRTRELNTSLTNEISGASLATNDITLPAGTYYIEASAPVHAVRRNAIRLRNRTDGVTLISGTSEWARTDAEADNMNIRAFLYGRFTLSAEKALGLQHACETTKLTNGFGVAVGGSFTVDTEVYADARIWKIK